MCFVDCLCLLFFSVVVVVVVVVLFVVCRVGKGMFFSVGRKEKEPWCDKLSFENCS